MELKDLQKAFHTKFVPPIILFHNAETSSENVSNITSTTNIGRKGTIGNSDKDSSSMVKNNVKLFNWLDGFFNLINWVSNLIWNLFPGSINIINFINIQSAREWTELGPDILVDSNI